MVRELDADFSNFQVQLHMLYTPGGFDTQDLMVQIGISHGSDDRRFGDSPRETQRAKNKERRNAMGEKSGKKNKEKVQKQNAEKQKQKAKGKLDKQPKKKLV